MTAVAISKVLETLYDVWGLLSKFTQQVFDVVTMSISDLAAMLTFADFAKPFWTWFFDTMGFGDLTLLDFVFATIPFFVAYTIIKWFTDVVL